MATRGEISGKYERKIVPALINHDLKYAEENRDNKNGAARVFSGAGNNEEQST